MWRGWERSDWLFVSACVVSGAWLALSLLGLHPDGAVLGFGGTMWMVWAASLKEREQRELRDLRDDLRKDLEQRRDPDDEPDG